MGKIIKKHFIALNWSLFTLVVYWLFLSYFYWKSLSQCGNKFDIKQKIVNTSFVSDWTSCGCGCGEAGPGIPGTLGTTVTGLTS